MKFFKSLFTYAVWPQKIFGGLHRCRYFQTFRRFFGTKNETLLFLHDVVLAYGPYKWATTHFQLGHIIAYKGILNLLGNIDNKMFN